MNLKLNNGNTFPCVSGYGTSLEALAGSQGLFRRAIAFNADNGADGNTGVAPETIQPPQDETQEDPVAGLKSALEKERLRANAEEKARKEQERQLKQLQESVKGIDPEKYKQFEALQAQHEEWNKKETDLRNLLENEFRQQIVSEQEKLKAAETKYNELQLRTAAEKAYHLANGRSGGGDDGVTFFDLFYQSQANRLKYNEQTKQLEVVDAVGAKLFSKKDTSKPMTAQEYFASLITHPVYGSYFLPDPSKRGSGTPPGSGTGNVTHGVDYSHLPPAERLSAVRAAQGR